MEQKTNLPSGYYPVATLCCVAAFCIPVFLLFGHSSFANLWLPYLGNALYGVTIFSAVLYYNNRKHGNANLQRMITSSLKLITASIVIICVVLLVLLRALQPDALTNAPANNVQGSTNGLSGILYMDAVIVNFLVGSFAAFIASVTSKRGQEDAGGTS